VLFDGVDKLQHFCWRFLDPALFPGKPSPWEQSVRALCLEYFRRVDHFIGEIVARAGPEATIVIASDHGFGSTVEIFYVNSWLASSGHLTWSESALGNGDEGQLGLETMAKRFYQVDWSRTRAHSPTPSSNGIYIPVAERPGDAGVPPDRYEPFRRELMESLQRFTWPPNGERVVKRIWTREEAFAGPFMPLAPDLTLSLRDGGFVSILPSEIPVKPRREPAGTHRPEGVLIAAGPGILPGTRLDRLSILDVAPLLLYTLGLPIPEDFEGRVPAEMYQRSWMAAHPFSKGGSLTPALESVRVPASSGDASKDDEQEIVRRLKALGYIE
jgi:predicted AlkP superfamily phosphohydrolase/phosphomutase